MTIITRFAPSPTGYLHIGHAHSALLGWRAARTAGGRFLLRIDDIDTSRCRPEFEAAIFEDLTWLGLDWEEPPRRQSDSTADYAAVLRELEGRGLVYPCFCTRKDIRAEIERSGAAPHDPNGPVYPGICRLLSEDERWARRERGDAFALRLDMESALRGTASLSWEEQDRGRVTADPSAQGDAVLARKEAAASYHLSVTVDDAVQDITLVTRGRDLYAFTAVHRLLQVLLGFKEPAYHHHALITDGQGKRLAKRHDALSIRHLREGGKTAAEVRALAGFPD